MTTLIIIAWYIAGVSNSFYVVHKEADVTVPMLPGLLAMSIAGPLVMPLWYLSGLIIKALNSDLVLIKKQAKPPEWPYTATKQEPREINLTRTY